MNPTWKSCANKRSILFTHTPGLTEYNLDKPNIQANSKTLNQIANYHVYLKYTKHSVDQKTTRHLVSQQTIPIKFTQKNTCNCGPAKTKDKEVDCM